MTSGPGSFDADHGQALDVRDGLSALTLAATLNDDRRALDVLRQGLAVVGDDDQVEYRLRMQAVRRAGEVGDLDEMLSHFDWCVHHNDLDPVRFPAQSDDEDLLGFHAWIPELLMQRADVSLEKVLHALDVMEQRWLREGLGLGAVLEQRATEAYRSGRPEAAEEYLAAIPSESDDDGPCQVCLRAERVEFLLDQGREQEALDAFDELIEAETSCDREPEAVMGRVLLPLLRAGRTEDAVKAHWMGYQLVRYDAGLLATIARHLEFCAVTENTGRALVLLQRHLPDLRALNVFSAARFHALVSIASACESLALRVGADRTLTLDPAVAEEAIGLDGDRITVGSVAEAAWAGARTLARAFDERNGTDRCARLVRDARARVLDTYPCDVGTVEDVSLPHPGAAAHPQDVDGWLAEMAWAGTSGDEERRKNAARAALALEPTPRERLKLYSIVASAAFAESEPDVLEHAVAARVAAYRELGMEESARLEEEHGVMLAGVLDEQQAALAGDLLSHADSDEVGARLSSDVALYLLHAGRQAEACKLYLAAADLAQRAEDTDLVRACLVGACWAVPLDADDGLMQGRLLESIEELGPWANQVYDVGYLRAVDQLAVVQDADAALATATAARDLALHHRASQPLLQISRFIADLLSQLGRQREAAQVMYVYAQAMEEMGEDADVMARVDQAKFLSHADLDYAALEVLDATRRDMESRLDHSPGQWASLERWNGQVALALGFLGTAVECYDRAVQDGERAMAEAPEVEDAQQAAFLGCQSARSIVSLAEQTDHPEDVRNFGERALALAESIHDHERGLLAVTRAQMGGAWVRLGDESGLQLLIQAEQAAKADGETWFAAETMDARGRALLELSRPDEAVPLLLSAADLFSDEGDQINAAMAEYAAGATLKDQGRSAEALSVLSSSLERIRDLETTEARATVAGLVVELLDAAGRSDEADGLRGLL
jgi:tetratricopeptide (TPR) repeat protein